MKNHELFLQRFFFVLSFNRNYISAFSLSYDVVLNVFFFWNFFRDWWQCFTESCFDCAFIFSGFYLMLQMHLSLTSPFSSIVISILCSRTLFWKDFCKWINVWEFIITVLERSEINLNVFLETQKFKYMQKFCCAYKKSFLSSFCWRIYGYPLPSRGSSPLTELFPSSPQPYQALCLKY